MTTIYERALDFIADDSAVGFGSGRAASEFIKLLAGRVRAGMRIRGVPTSRKSAELAQGLGIPLVSLEEGMPLAVTVDGADEVDPHCNLIKGYGRALVREKIVAAASRMLVILVGPGKTTPVLGTRGNLPVEVVPFALSLCRARLGELGLRPVPFEAEGKLFLSDNGNAILDCGVDPIQDPAALEARIRAIPGVVGTGLFLGMADVVLVGDDQFQLKEERRRGAVAPGR
jgi:ribose 5-phosphate isomerase A